jgi:hypothetical protein
VKITDYSRSTPGLWLGTAANANAIGGVSFSSNSPALPGSIPVSISSNMLVWRDALSFGSNTNDVSSVGTMGSSPSNTRADHVHRGVHAIAVSSNTLYGDVALVAGTGMGITTAGQSVTFESSGGSSISIGSNSTDVSGSTSLGGLTTYAPSTHLHRGVHSLSHTSNTFYGDVTLVAGAGVGITVPVPGSFALNATGGGGGGGSGTVTTVKDEGSTLSTAVVSMDFVGAGVTATGTTAVTITIPGGGGGSLVLLEQHTASNSATLDFTTCISATYDEYLVEILNLVPATAGAIDLWWRVSTDGGSTYDAGANYNYVGNLTVAGGSGQAGATAAAQAALTIGNGPTSTASNGGITGSMRLVNPASTADWKRGKFSGDWVRQVDNAFATGTCSVAYTVTASAYNAFRFLMSSGNITSGTVRVYGIAKT